MQTCSNSFTVFFYIELNYSMLIAIGTYRYALSLQVILEKNLKKKKKTEIDSLIDLLVATLSLQLINFKIEAGSDHKMVKNKTKQLKQSKYIKKIIKGD